MNEARPYDSPLRRAQAEATRERILAALAGLLEGGGEEMPSNAAIAAAAGVKEVTVYRHFPNRDALLDAFWVWINRQAGFLAFPQTEAELLGQPPRVFAGFDRMEGVIRASLRTRQGRELRLRANAERQEAFRRCLAPALQGLEPPEARRLLAVVQLLYSASAWQTMKDYWGLDGAEAGEAAAWAIRTLIDAVRTPREEDTP